MDVFSAGVSGIINHLPCHQPLGAASTSLHPASDHHTSPHLPQRQRLSWMGAMSPSNPVSGIWTPSRPGSLRPPHLPPVPLFVAPRSRKPRKETAYQRALLVLIAHLWSSLASRGADPVPIRTSASHHGFFEEERWCCRRRGQEGSIPCRPQGARRRQPVRRSQAPPGYSPSCSSRQLSLLPFSLTPLDRNSNILYRHSSSPGVTVSSSIYS